MAKNSTRVFAPNGDDITDYVQSVSFVHKAGDIPRVTLTLLDNKVDVSVPHTELRKDGESLGC